MNGMVPAHPIGDYVPLVDGPEKVSGRAKYTADLIVAGMAFDHVAGPKKFPHLTVMT